MLLKLFQNWSGGVIVIPICHFFEILKNFSFLGLSREPFEIPYHTLVYTGQKSSTHDKKTFDVVFFDPPPVFNNGGVRENLSFSIMLDYLVTPLRYIYRFNLYENLHLCVFRGFITNYDVKMLVVSPLW